jgi:Tfp pilus assembly protein PilX
MSAVSASRRARYFAATAVEAAVRNAVIDIESITASGRPLTASQRTTTPCIVGNPCRAPL